MTKETLLLWVSLAGWVGLGAWAVWRLARRPLRRWLGARHERACEPLNKLWNRRIVRHAATGRIGMCVQVCVRESGWRDLVWPRWTATVALTPLLARCASGPVGLESMEEMQAMAAEVRADAAGGGMARIALRELTLAPQREAETFREAMQRRTA